MDKGKNVLKYNFVIFFAREDFWKAIFGKELYESEYVHIYKHAFTSSKFIEKIFHYHWSYRINRIIKLPFKRIWFKKMYTQKFNNELPICFIFLGGNNVVYDAGFTKYVKKKDSRNKTVVLHEDLISKKMDYSYELVRSKVDMSITYDKKDAEKYGIYYFQETTYSKLLPEPEKASFLQDVYFLGAAKDRLKKIMEVYYFLSSHGVKCKFVIAGVPREQQKEENGIVYTDGITYLENLNNIIHSKCVLELIQGGSCDITTRALEAIAYRRKLITDCTLIPKEFFNNNQLQVFSSANDINLEFIKDRFNPNQYEPKTDLNPFKRLYFIQDILERLDEK